MSPIIGDVTHFTSFYADENAIIDGTGAFKAATGTARLAGPGNFEDTFSLGILSIDCIFVTELD